MLTSGFWGMCRRARAPARDGVGPPRGLWLSPRPLRSLQQRHVLAAVTGVLGRLAQGRLVVLACCAKRRSPVVRRRPYSHSIVDIWLAILGRIALV